MSGPRCNLPPERHEEILARFSGELSIDEENAIRDMFPQYLFFRNEYTDDGWEVSSTPVRLCTCTACRETFEAVRGNYPRGKLHGERCNCPNCGREVEGRAVHKYKYEMRSLAQWIKTAVLRVEDGALLIEAGEALRKFTWDDLEGDIIWQPRRRYYIAPGVVQGWYYGVVPGSWWCGQYMMEWHARKTVEDVFHPEMYTYNGAYTVVGLEKALALPGFKYCQIEDFYHYQYAADILRDAARWIVPYLAWYALHPQIEMAVKLGFADAVEELIENGRKNARLLNWTAKTPKDFLKLSAEDAKAVLRAEIGLDGLRKWKEQAGSLGITRYMEIMERVGRDNMQLLCSCAKDAGCGLPAAVRYVERLRPPCPQYGVPLREILRAWSDYLDMAHTLGYDLSEKTVAMPKDLQRRHDAAAETIRVESGRVEMKKYKQRRRMLEKKFAFALEGLRVVVPVSSAEIVQEGKTLHHCVGGYAARHVEGKTTILFIRKRRTPGRSFLTVELTEDKRGRWSIVQVHGYRNEGYASGEAKEAVRPSTRYKWFLDAWLGWVNAGSQRDKDGSPVLPGTDKTKEEAV
ncbi:MAG: PcfJ domain-containing protein [Bacteroidales bacterium]|nr:PcfJ domain-containing protein [Bacteroidales bacterium]